MAPFISTEMFENMVIWWFKQHKTVVEIARLASCLESTVYEVLQLHCEYGEVTNPHASPRGCPCLLQTADIEYIHLLLLTNPATYVHQ